MHLSKVSTTKYANYNGLVSEITNHQTLTENSIFMQLYKGIQYLCTVEYKEGYFEYNGFKYLTILEVMEDVLD